MNGRAKTSCSSATSRSLRRACARERFEPRLPNPAYTGPGRDEFGPEAPAGPFPESSAKQVPPTNLTARKKPAAARSKAKAAARHAAKPWREEARSSADHTESTDQGAGLSESRKTFDRAEAGVFSQRRRVAAGGPSHSRSAEETAVHRAPPETVTLARPCRSEIRG